MAIFLKESTLFGVSCSTSLLNIVKLTHTCEVKLQYSPSTVVKYNTQIKPGKTLDRKKVTNYV